MTRDARTIILTLAAVIVGAAATRAEAQPSETGTYTIIDLGTLGGLTANARGINRLAQVVGEADLPNGVRHGFIWTNGVMTDVGTLPGEEWSDCRDINNLGQAICNSSPSIEPSSAFLWDNGERVDLGDLAATPDTTGYAVNDATQIVGFSRVGVEKLHAFLWEGSVLRDLTAEGLPAAIVRDINASGQLVAAGYLWDHGVVVELPTLGGPTSDASGLNDQGLVIGGADNAEGLPRAALWVDGEVYDLAGLAFARPVAINNCNEILLSTGDGPYPDNLYILNLKGELRLLPRMTGPRTGWFDLDANDMNDFLEIVGVGSHNGPRRGFL